MAAREKRVFVHKNAPHAEAQALVVKDKDTFAKFKKAAGKKVGVSKAKRVFLASGAEIMGMDEMQANDKLYISEGEPFYRSAGAGAGTETLHIAVLGAGSVGKSALTLRFVRDFFIKDWDPTIEDAYRKTVNIDDRACQLEILDTAGQDDFESLRPQWMMDKDGYLFVYAMDQKASIGELHPFYELHKQINDGKDVPIVVVGNKKDIVDDNPSARQVPRADGEATAERYDGAQYIETSAFSGENVAEAFAAVVREIRERRRPKATETESTRRFCTLL